MKRNYIPDSVENRLAWLTNLKTEVTENAAALSWDAAKLAAFTAVIDPLVALYTAVVAAESALRQATGDANGQFASSSEELRALIAEIKANPGFTEGMGAAMKIFTVNSTMQPEDIKPTLKVVAQRGSVSISGSKNYAETVNIYMRRKSGPWVLIAPKRKRFPFDDQTPLTVAGTPEEREYMARGVNGDTEVGQDSDIVSTVFGG